MDKAGQDNFYDWKHRFSSGQIGVAVPLFNKSQKNKIKAAQANEKLAEANYRVAEQQLTVQLQQRLLLFQKNSKAIQYYKASALPQATIIVENASKQYTSGAINYLDWVMLMRNALNIQSQYIDQLNAMQMDVIQLEYLLSAN